MKTATTRCPRLLCTKDYDRLLITLFFARVRPRIWSVLRIGDNSEVTSSLLLLVERRLLPAPHVGRSLKFFEGPSAGFF
jgi:hypothetical protein